jgi:hypothetical protein
MQQPQTYEISFVAVRDVSQLRAITSSLPLVVTAAAGLRILRHALRFLGGRISKDAWTLPTNEERAGSLALSSLCVASPSPSMTAAELIRTSHPFLEGLSNKQVGTLATLAMPVSYSAGQTIFKEGDIADRFYLINEGTVSLQAHRGGEEEIEIQQLRSGDVLGWSWLFEPYAWQYDAVATAPVSATFFYGTWLRDRCEQDTALGYEIMKRIAAVVIGRLQATRKSLEMLQVA